MRNKSKDNGKYIVESFTHQDMSLVLAYNRIRKFEIKKAKDLKHGVIVSVRETLSLRNIYVEVMQLDGKAVRAGWSYPSMVFARVSPVYPASEAMLKRPRDYCQYAVRVNHKPVYKRAADKRMKSSEITLGGMHVSTLLRYGNRAFKYNTKVKQFFELLKEYPRFQQHCILSNVPYTQEEYDKFVSEVQDTKMFDDSFDKIVDKSYEDSY